MGEFIGDDRHPNARAAYQDSALDLAGRHRLSQRNGKIGIIAGFFARCSQVSDGIGMLDEPALDRLFKAKAGMIASDANAFLRHTSGPSRVLTSRERERYPAVGLQVVHGSTTQPV